MDPITWILSGICLTLLSGGVGHYVGTRDKVSEKECLSKRSGCGQLHEMEMKHIKASLQRIERRLGLNGGPQPQDD